MRFLAIVASILFLACSAEEKRTMQIETAGSGGSNYVPYYSGISDSGLLERLGSGGFGIGGYPAISGAGGFSGFFGNGGQSAMDGSFAGTSAASDGGDLDATLPTYQLCKDSDAAEEDDGGSDGEPCLKMNGLKVQYIMISEGNNSEHYRITFNIVNLDAPEIPLQALSLRYYYTADQGSQDQQFDCWFAEIDCSNVHASFIEYTGTDADSYLELSFDGGGPLNAGDQTGQIQTGFHKSDWTRYDFTNDYSYQPTSGGFADAPRVTLYYDDNLVWGVLPN